MLDEGIVGVTGWTDRLEKQGPSRYTPVTVTFELWCVELLPLVRCSAESDHLSSPGMHTWGPYGAAIALVERVHGLLPPIYQETRCRAIVHGQRRLLVGA